MQMLFHFVNIPLRAIRHHSTFIFEQLRPHLTPGGRSSLEKCVATLQGLNDVDEEVDIAPYLFDSDRNVQDIRALPRPSDGSGTSVKALDQGFFKSSCHNLLSDTNMPSPAQMLIKRLLGLVNLAHCIPSPIKFYANFTSLVQGSGSGKSRMAKECSQRFYVVYLCLRPETSSGVPPRSLLATSLLQLVETVTSEYECNACFNRFFAAIFHVIATQVDWEAFRTDGVVSPASFWDYTMVTHASAFAEEVLEVYNDWDAHSIQPGPTSNHMYEALKVLNPPGSTHVGPFLVVLDETRELLRACRYMPGEPPLFLQWRRWLAKKLPNRLARVMQSAMSFTGWTVAEEPIIREMLQFAWCHRVGYLCNDQEPATDLVLPLVRKRSTSGSVKVTRPVAAIPGKGEKRTVKTNIPVITSPPTKPATTRMSSRASAMDTAGSTLEDEMDTEGAAAKAKLEALTTHDRRQLEERYLAEYMNSTLAEQYSLIGRNLVGRLPSNYDVGAYEEPAGENDEAVAMASEPVPPLSSKKSARLLGSDDFNVGSFAAEDDAFAAASEPVRPPTEAKGKSPAIAAVGTAASAAAEAAPPVSPPSSVPWTHTDITVTSEGIQRHLRVYWAA
eukprot:gene14021-10019_t